MPHLLHTYTKLRLEYGIPKDGIAALAAGIKENRAILGEHPTISVDTDSRRIEIKGSPVEHPSARDGQQTATVRITPEGASVGMVPPGGVHDSNADKLVNTFARIAPKVFPTPR
jgi:hypothetical protein